MAAEVTVLKPKDDSIILPPGFRFHPTDEEIIVYYLTEKVLNPGFISLVMADVDLNKNEPWHLPGKAKMGEKEWYFFCQKDRKYPTGMRTNRATESGYWKATGKDKEIYCKGRRVLVGMKKTLVFYLGRAPKGEKTNWVMHEYRLEGQPPFHQISTSKKDSWVVCRVFHKNQSMKKSSVLDLARMNSDGNDLVDGPTLPPPSDTPHFNYNLTEEYKDSFLNHDNYLNFHNQITTPNQNNYLRRTCLANSGYWHHDEANLRALAAPSGGPPSIGMHCKGEQFSSPSMATASQGAVLSPETNTEISSVIPKNENDGIQPFDYFGDPYNDLTNLWSY